MNSRLNRTSRPSFVTRPLRLGDIPALIDLEKKQWTAEQAATADDFRHRIATDPDLSIGAFRADTGELVASCFCRPTSASDWADPADWSTSASRVRAARPDSLFGISLTSIDGAAALQLVAFQYLYAVKRGVKHVYLGSPMPGLARHLARNPDADVEAYARSTRCGLPADPQLRYYHGRGFCEVIAVVPEYFPHEASRNYGAILRAKVPYRWLHPLFRFMPVAVLVALAAVAPKLAIPSREPAAGPSTSPT